MEALLKTLSTPAHVGLVGKLQKQRDDAAFKFCIRDVLAVATKNGYTQEQKDELIAEAATMYGTKAISEWRESICGPVVVPQHILDEIQVMRQNELNLRKRP